MAVPTHRSVAFVLAPILMVTLPVVACGGSMSSQPGAADASGADVTTSDAGHGAVNDGASSEGAAGPADTGAAHDAFGETADDATPTPDARSPDSSPDGPADGPPSDAPADVDNGAPSTSYPAPHPPLPVLTNASGGPVLHTPTIQFVLYPGNSSQADFVTYAQHLAGSAYWSATTQEYGVGALSYGATTVLTGQTAPGTITSAQVKSWMGQEIASGAFGTPDPQTIYTVVYPSTTQIQQPNPVSALFGPINSCTSFTGYHDNVSVALTDGGAPTTFAYAVIATCTTSLGDLTSVMSHEWVEASTDPQLTSTGVFNVTGGPNAAYFSVDSDHIVWDVLSSGGEAGDLCQPERPEAIYTPSDIGYAVQRTWSNKLAAASHDPCAPDLAGLPFFDSAPVLDGTVTFTSAITGAITTKGVTIPVGQSRTIEVDLFSDSATGGPWTVTADDLLYREYSSYGLANTLSFQWDRSQGTNGEKLHLTITVTGASPLGGAHAFVITSTLGSRKYQWPGVVVEQ
jgi:hypothetical protein